MGEGLGLAAVIENATDAQKERDEGAFVRCSLQVNRSLD